jgi:hypothetical protein
MPPINRLMRRLKKHTSVARIFRMQEPGAMYRRPQVLQQISTPTEYRPAAQKVAAVLPGERLSALPRGLVVNRPVPEKDIDLSISSDQLNVPLEQATSASAKPSPRPDTVQRVPTEPTASKAPSAELEKEWPRLRNILHRHQETAVQQQDEKLDEAGKEHLDIDEQAAGPVATIPSVPAPQGKPQTTEESEPIPSKSLGDDGISRRPAITEIGPKAKTPVSTSTSLQPSEEQRGSALGATEIAEDTTAKSDETERTPEETPDEGIPALPAEEMPKQEIPVSKQAIQEKPAETGIPSVDAADVEKLVFQEEIADEASPGLDFPDSSIEETSTPPPDDLIQQSTAETKVVSARIPDIPAAHERDLVEEQYQPRAKSTERGKPPTREVSKEEALPGEESSPEKPQQTRQTIPLEAAWPVERHPRPQPEFIETATARKVETPQEVNESMDRQPVDEAPIQRALEGIAIRQPTESKVEIITPRRPRPAASAVQEQAQPEIVRPSPEAGEEIPGEREDASLEAPPSSSEASQGAPSTVQMAAEPKQIQTDIGPLPADLWKLIGQEVPTQEKLSRSQIETPPPSQPQAVVQHTLQAEKVEHEHASPALQDFPRSVQTEPPIIIQRVTEQTEAQSAEQPSTGSTETESTQAPETTQQEQQEEKINVEELAHKVYEAIRHRLITALSIERERTRRNP